MNARRLLVTLALGALVAASAACGDDHPDGTGQTTSGVPTCEVGGDEPVAFGEGEIPASVPDDLPMPGGAAVGSTMVDRVNHRTEFAFTVAMDITQLVQYYTVNLVSEGFVVDSSQGDALTWQIRFSRGDLRGEIVMQPGGTGLAAGVVGLNTC